MGNSESQEAGGTNNGTQSNKSSSKTKATLTEAERKKYYDGPNQIQLAYSVLGGMPGMQAYHTSVVVNGVEFFFDQAGVMSTSDFSSHRKPEQEGGSGNGGGGAGVNYSNSQSTQIDSGGGGGGQRMGPPQYQLMDFGGSKKSSQDLLNALSPYFQSNSYDLLRKNCNSFSDAAIWFLTGKRIPNQFRQLEQMGAKFPSLLAGQGYEKNPKADDFDLEKIIDKYDIGKMWSSPGYTLGGGGGGGNNNSGGSSETLSPEEMRRRRLEALERREAEAKAAKEAAATGAGN